ncbi:MAG: ubiquitin-conjugating enzyme E2 [Bacteroidota bacterium]
MQSSDFPIIEGPNYDLGKIQKEFVFRRAQEHIFLHTLYQSNASLFHYEVLKKDRRKPNVPIDYRVHYFIRSIIGIEEDESPQYQDSHVLRIQLPSNFPLQPAICKFETPVWHPNVKYTGYRKGHICTNTEGFGSLFSLDQLVVRIGEMLQYKKYFAIPYQAPLPEDKTVAAWIRSYAEVQGIVNKNTGIVLDDTAWIKTWELSDSKKKIRIIKKKNSADQNGSSPGISISEV